VYKGTWIEFGNGLGNQKAILLFEIGRIVKRIKQGLSMTSTFIEGNRVIYTRRHLKGNQHRDVLSTAEDSCPMLWKALEG